MLEKNLLRVIILTGLLAGTLDGLAAIVVFLIRGGKEPAKIFNFIASGIFGKAAFSTGLTMPLLGLLFHLIIATIWTFLFFFVYAKVKVLSTSWLLSGLGYGVFVWLGMNLIVVPLSSTPPLTHNTSSVLVGMFVLMICIGLPISFFAHKYYK